MPTYSHPTARRQARRHLRQDDRRHPNLDHPLLGGLPAVDARVVQDLSHRLPLDLSRYDEARVSNEGKMVTLWTITDTAGNSARETFSLVHTGSGIGNPYGQWMRG